MTQELIFKGSVHYDSYQLDFDLNLVGHGTTAFWGPSGAGKSTLLKAIAGLVKPEHGYININGQVWQDSEKRIFVPTYQRALGFVFQDARLFSHLNVIKNLQFGMKRVSKSSKAISLDYVIELLGIGHLLDRSATTLSGGEQQRVSIARALATSPDILLLDEPLSALDDARKQEIIPYLRRLNDKLEIPILYVSHSIEEVSVLADQLVLLNQGKVIATGDTQSILTRLDLPLAHDRSSTSIIKGTITEIDPQFQLCTLSFNGGYLFLPNQNMRIGDHVRVRIQAQDVSLALQRAENSSILNIIKATVINVFDDEAGQVIVELDLRGNHILSKITRKSASSLSIKPGRELYAQIKGIAVVL